MRSSTKKATHKKGRPLEWTAFLVSNALPHQGEDVGSGVRLSEFIYHSNHSDGG